MARLPRLALAGELHHVMLRGLVGQPVFRDDSDRAAFVAMLREAAAGEHVAIHAYVLLDHEVHLLATPTEAAALGRMVQNVGRRYVAAFNRRHGRRGTLWEGRFGASVLEAEPWLLDASVVVETLPVRAGIVGAAADWPWSSAGHHAGRRRDPLVSDHPAYWRLGNTPFERELAHTRALEAGVPDHTVEQLAAATRRGHALGSPAFVSRLAEEARRTVQPRPKGRPRSHAETI